MRGAARSRCVLALAVALGVLGSSSAQAAFEQPAPPEGTFAEAGEELQLGGTGGMAVNYTGAGGVPAGTLYAVTRGAAGNTTLRIAQYRPKEGGMEFALGWLIRPVEGEYERCGPLAGGPPAVEHCPTRPAAPTKAVGVAVDQETGSVYVLSTEDVSAGEMAVREFDANGTEVKARFGEVAPAGKTTAETPGQVHSSPTPGGIAVDKLGEVFVYDRNGVGEVRRLMRFRPKTPGDFSSYEYVAGGDVAVVTGVKNSPSAPVLDALGNVYVAGETYIEKYDPAQPANPVCSFEFKPGGVTAMTVNPATGEPFFYTSNDTRIHRLSACTAGKFSEVESLPLAPQNSALSALVFDPVRHLRSTRDAGVLFAAAPEPKVGGPGKTSLGYIFAPVEEHPPEVQSEQALRVGEGFAELGAEVHPNGFPTRYVFEYLSESEYLENGESFEGPSEPRHAPLGGALAGGGTTPIAVAVVIGGLGADTEYRFRVMVSSECAPKLKPGEICEVVGPLRSFRTFAAGAGVRPGGRGFELVSPAMKSGGQVFPAEPNLSSCMPVECKPGAPYQHFPMQSSPDGSRIVYEGSAFSPGEGAVIENQYVAQRGTNGWRTTNLTPPLLASKGGQGYKAFDEQLNDGILEQITPALSPQAPPGFTNLYLQSNGQPLSLDPLLSEGSVFLHRLPGNGAGALRLTYAGSAAGFSKQFFQANDALTEEEDEGEETNLYEWAGGQLRLVNVDGGGEPSPGAVFGSAGLLNGGFVFTNAFSSDGSRAFWTAASGKLFVRVGGAETVEVPGPGNCRTSVPVAERACFLTAAADGSEVLLSDGQIYRLNDETGAYEAAADLTEGKGGFEGIVGQDDPDLSHLYFIDEEALAAGAQPRACKLPPEGSQEREEEDEGKVPSGFGCNLYSYVGGTTSFVGTLLARDSATWEVSPGKRMGEASPSGRWLAFLSRAPLTGYDNVGPCQVTAGKIVQVPCSEVFLYDSETSTLLCASCNPTGVAPIGQSYLRQILNLPAATPQPRYLTDSGRLYFDSRDTLVPSDTNNGVEDVFQFQPPGSDEIGSCGREKGCVSLISGGGGTADSNLVAVDEKGRNVFFTTRDQLVSADVDELYDLYDARVDGGFPAEPAATPCQGESCQPALPVPVEPLPNSSSTGPSGNYKPPKCKKGQVRRNGKCVKKKKQKSKQGGKGKGKAKKQGGSK